MKLPRDVSGQDLAKALRKLGLDSRGSIPRPALGRPPLAAAPW